MSNITAISAFLGGAIVGAAVALLVAPEKGSDTRKPQPQSQPPTACSRRMVTGTAECLPLRKKVLFQSELILKKPPEPFPSGPGGLLFSPIISLSHCEMPAGSP